MTYRGDFWKNWQDVCQDFECNEPVPDEVILAQYTDEGYEGAAFVVYRNGDKYYTVDGGHCSCYGLGGQWKPEEYTLHQLVVALHKSWRHEKHELLSFLEPRLQAAA
jgi:hypothetical protein